MLHTRGTAGDVIIQELIRVAMWRLANKRGRPHITKKEILKILFKTKMRLPDNNSIKGLLAYYWYLEGPYSERVYTCLDRLVGSGVAVRSKTDRYETYRLAPQHPGKPLAPTSDDLDVARREIGVVVADFVNVVDSVREIYQDAPYKWYLAYKEGFKPKFESYCNAVLHSGLTEHAPKDVVDWLDRIVLEYPPLPKFIEHRRIVMDFAKMLHAVIQSDPHHKHTNLLEELLDLSGRIWDVFARAVRLEHHDGYYDGHVDGWREEYVLAVNKLDRDIREQALVFEGLVQDNIRLASEIEDALEWSDELEPVTPDAILELALTYATTATGRFSGTKSSSCGSRNTSVTTKCARHWLRA